MPRVSPSLAWCAPTASLSVCAFVAFLAQSAAYDNPRVFVAITNVAFWMQLPLLGLVAWSCRLSCIDALLHGFALVQNLLGCASLVYHLQRGLHRPPHHLDIFLGWMFYLYLPLLVVYSAVRIDERHRIAAQSAFVAAFSSAATVLLAFYDDVYGDQTSLYASLAAVFYVGYPVARMRGGAQRPLPVVVDTGILFALQTAATGLQGELWWQWDDPVDYNLGHGYWHLINVLVGNVVAIQLAQRGCDPPPATEARHEVVARAGLLAFVGGLMLVRAAALDALYTMLLAGLLQSALLAVSLYAIADASKQPASRLDC